MIIVQDAKAQPAPAPAPGPAYIPSSRFGSEPAADPPSYSASYHDHDTTPLLPPPPSYPNHHQYPTGNHSHGSAFPEPSPAVVYHRPSSSSPLARFCKAFVVALLLYLLALALVNVVIYMASRGHTHRQITPGVPRPEDGRVLVTIGRHDWTAHHPLPRWAPDFLESAETSFTLPVAAAELYLMSRGSSQGGRVRVAQSTERGGLHVKVDVRVAYREERALERVSVCRLQKGENREGVGIYTPTSTWSDVRDQLHFEVVFTFPAAPSARTPLSVKAFTTHTSNFAYEIGDLWKSLLFDNVDINASNANVRASALTLTRGSVTSSNGYITGHFNTSDSLVLHTSNARIEATASLFNAGPNATKLEMRTSNGRITSSVSMATASGTGGDFVVMARTSNGMLKLGYDDSPLGARLVSDARTSNGPAAVVVHPAFEGRYEAVTSNATPVVRERRVADPAKKGRRRVVRQTVGRNMVEGVVYWEGSGNGGGSCVVHTSNAPLSLDL